MKISTRTRTRLVEGLRKYLPIVAAAKVRDLNEADTSRVVQDVLSDLLGFDRYTEITSEYCIRGTYCDLAIKLNDQPRLLIEVKAAGLELKDMHVKQAVDYAANLGTDWVVLTNGSQWKVFHVTFSKPIEKEETVSFDLSAMNPKTEQDIELLFLISKEGLIESALGEFREQKKAVNKFVVSAVLQSEPVLKAVRKELSRLNPEVRIDIEDVCKVLTADVLKREVVDSEEAQLTAKKVKAAFLRMEKRKEKAEENFVVQPPGTAESTEPDAQAV